jgi:hypothetical protein
MFDQKLHNLLMPMPGSQHDARLTKTVGVVHFGPVLKEDDCEISVAMLSRHGQCCVILLVLYTASL